KQGNRTKEGNKGRKQGNKEKNKEQEGNKEIEPGREQRKIQQQLMFSGHGELGAFCGEDTKGFEVTAIHVIQNPTMWSNYMYQKGKIMASFNSKKNDGVHYSFFSLFSFLFFFFLFL